MSRAGRGRPAAVKVSVLPRYRSWSIEPLTGTRQILAYQAELDMFCAGFLRLRKQVLAHHPLRPLDGDFDLGEIGRSWAARGRGPGRRRSSGLTITVARWTMLPDTAPTAFATSACSGMTSSVRSVSATRGR